MQLSGKTITVDVEKGDSIAMVKCRVQEKEGYPTVNQENVKILYNGKQLEDSRSIMDYGIEKESVLHFRLRLRSSLNTADSEQESNTVGVETKSLAGNKRHRNSESVENLPKDGEVSKFSRSSFALQDGSDHMRISIVTVNLAS